MKIEYDKFKPSGKWYATEDIDVPNEFLFEYSAVNTYHFRNWLEEEIKKQMDKGWHAVMILTPENDKLLGFPMMVKRFL